jgi:hypothetical protein
MGEDVVAIATAGVDVDAEAVAATGVGADSSSSTTTCEGAFLFMSGYVYEQGCRSFNASNLKETAVTNIPIYTQITLPSCIGCVQCMTLQLFQLIHLYTHLWGVLLLLL